MKKAMFYISSTAAIALFVLIMALLGAVDAGAPIFKSYMLIVPLCGASFGLFFISQGLAISEGMLDWEDDDESGI